MTYQALGTPVSKNHLYVSSQNKLEVDEATIFVLHWLQLLRERTIARSLRLELAKKSPSIWSSFTKLLERVNCGPTPYVQVPAT